MKSSSNKQKPIYINQKQQDFLKLTTKMKLFRGGRGIGKTYVLWMSQYASMCAFPGAKGYVSSSTYAQILTKTISDLPVLWGLHGLKENIHYVVGKKPPVAFIKRMKSVPRRWENIITVFNGYHIEFLSMDRPDLARGGSYVCGDVDEGLNVKKEALTKVLIPSMRGHIRHRKHPMYRQTRVYSSVPWKVSGYWIMEWNEWVKSDPGTFGLVEASTIDNVALLGLDYIEMLRKTLPPLEFQVEVLNMFIKRAPNGFYHRFNESKHCVKDTYRYGVGERGIILEGDKDVNKDAFIDFTLDFGGRFNCGLAAQFDWHNNTLNFLREFYFKDDEGKIRELVNAFCDQYKSHKVKHVRLFGEPRGKDRQADGDPYFTRMQHYFFIRGWTSEIRADASAEEHLIRHNIITEIFEEKDERFPKVRINENNCMNFIIVLQTTGIKDDYTKDKSKEKDANFPQEKAPHFSDAFDNYITQSFTHLLELDGSYWMQSSMDFL